jgi:hypothetical protein
MNNERIINVANPVDDAVNKKHLDDILKAEIYQPVLPPNNPDWIRFFEMNLLSYRTIDPEIFTIKGALKIKQNVATKHTWTGNVSVNQIDFVSFL